MSQVITIDDFTTYMAGKTFDDGLAQQTVDAMNQWIENYTNRCWGETKQVTERYDWGQNPLWLRHQDLVSVDSVSLGYPGQASSALDSTSYYSNPLGRVTFFQFAGSSMSRLYNDFLEMTYTYGHVAVPDDLKSALLAVAAGFYTWASNGNKDVSAVSVGSYSIEYTNKRMSSDSTPDPATSSGDANWQIITSYKQRRQ